MKLKKKTVCMVLVIVFLVAGFSGFSVMAANEKPDKEANESQAEVIITDYTGKKKPDLLSLSEGGFTAEKGETVVALPTPMPEGKQMLKQDAEEGAPVRVEEHIVDGKTITIEVYYNVSKEDIEIPEGFSEWETVTLYADPPSFMERSSYTPEVHQCEVKYLEDGDLVAVVSAEYEVWYYTDDKVHLYSRTFSKLTAAGYGESYFEYGSIVNTDGAISYTSGDRFYVKGKGVNRAHAINFFVTPTYYYFY